MKITDIKIIVASPGCNFVTVEVMTDGDAAVVLSARPNPISKRGLPTAIELAQGRPLTISHSVTAFGLSEAEMRVG